MKNETPITIEQFTEDLFTAISRIESAKLVALDKNGVPRYVTGYDIHETLNAEDCNDVYKEDVNLPRAETARIIFILGDVAKL